MEQIVNILLETANELKNGAKKKTVPKGKPKKWTELEPLLTPKIISTSIRLLKLPKLRDSYDPLLTIKESNIHGMGVFVTEDTPVNTPISLYLQSLQTEHNDYVRTDVARLTNHSTNPNVKLQEHNGDLYITTSKDILEGDELLIDYFEVAKIAQPRTILKDSFVRLCPEIDEEILQDPPGIDFYKDLEYLAQLEID